MPHFHTDGRAADAAAQDFGAHAREHQLCQPLHVALRVLHAQPEEERRIAQGGLSSVLLPSTPESEVSLKGD